MFNGVAEIDGERDSRTIEMDVVFRVGSDDDVGDGDNVASRECFELINNSLTSIETFPSFSVLQRLELRLLRFWDTETALISKALST